MLVGRGVVGGQPGIHSGPRSGARRFAPDDLVRIAQRATADTVRQALEGAAQRLESERCRGLLLEFEDSARRPLQEALDLTGYTPAGYLGRSSSIRLP